MTTDTTAPAIDQAAPAPAAAPAASNTYSLISLVLSLLSLPLGTGVLAIAGIVMGFLARTREPASVTTANWGIVIGFLSLFGWVLLAIGGIALFAPWAFVAWAWGAY